MRDESDEKAYRDIESLIAQSTPGEAWAMHFVSAGAVRGNIETAVAALIAKGNKALELEFPQLAQASRSSQLLGDRNERQLR
ncbi:MULTISPECIES: hypothetical protein [unclassified Pseudomonas]|uniref:hypothetical protein n=1 Tax=unclassified Pseudomonas TaxID=196821 RepID=UPI002AB34C36|nr:MULTISPECIES: hypothetical protein [unclassified Pseudomonas]MDY7563419.1 hypothetical protein [Pseudomonas sp. AB6]MEA9979857.1 hypothetical protein [Pseudomonas sp. RTS4]MEA9996489.1 hypothetical protein [Pseudomonas sp. AA4]MEB0198159.1 hypothetical protein [Pseudomonas sp. 5S4]MEB0213496.1 hypothetical protein [Pseudomonas sp. AB6]